MHRDAVSFGEGLKTRVDVFWSRCGILFFVTTILWDAAHRAQAALLPTPSFGKRFPEPQVVSPCLRGAVANLLTPGERPAVCSKSQKCVSDQLLLRFTAHPCAVPVFQGTPRLFCARHPRWRALTQSPHPDDTCEENPVGCGFIIDKLVCAWEGGLTVSNL